MMGSRYGTKVPALRRAILDPASFPGLSSVVAGPGCSSV